MRLFNGILLLGALLVGCTSDKSAIDDVTDDVTAVDDQNQPESNPEDQTPTEEEFVLEPTHVFFYTTAVINEDASLDCYDTDDGEWCGVFRYFLADTSSWTGLDDYTNVCHVVHALRPEHVVNNNDPTTFIDAGDWYGWTMKASETFYGVSDSCSSIPNDHKTKILVGQFANKNYSFGYGPATGEHLEYFNEYIEEQVGNGVDVPSWDDYWAPNIIANSIIAGGTTELTQPNYGFTFQLDSTGTPISTDDQLQFIEMQNATGLVHGYYRSKTWWGYNVDDYIPAEE